MLKLIALGMDANIAGIKSKELRLPVTYHLRFSFDRRWITEG